RNTAPATALAALSAIQRDPNAQILVLPADHAIADTAAFVQAVTQGQRDAAQRKLVTFGIKPSSAETGYGYIQAQDVSENSSFPIQAFVEKPNLSTAQAYLDSGNYYWNSGMFLFGAQTWLDELGRHAPEILHQAQKAYAASDTDLDFVRIDTEAFAACPADSIDYAVMEHTDDGVVIPLQCGWNDVGSWSSLWEMGAQDTEHNVTHGDVVLHDVKESLVRAESRLTAVLGVEGVVVIETADAVLVADRHKVQDIKAIVAELKRKEREEVTSHKKVYRPWGSYESLVNAGRFQVKRIIVNPEQTLSLQMHHHRAEHWIVVNGTATVTCGEDEFLLGEDQSTYIPLGNKHRLQNSGVIPLEIIEVQTGSYLGEDDIVRFEDIYGRSG
ncbi:MAG: mannose-1-phosphate guanylyltransferase/mannose-6-phosphate isomerase, partial [Pseudomonadales bacterium]